MMFKEFNLPILFDISTTKSIDKNKLDFVDDGEYDFIGRTPADWGIQGKLHKLSFEPNPKDSFSLIQVGETVALWREREWYASQNLFLLNPKIDEIKENKLYFQCAINKEMSRYGKEYNSYPTMKSLAITKIILPVIENPNPCHEYTIDDIDWQYMRDRITELERDRITKLDAYLKATRLEDYELTDADKKVISLSTKRTSDEDRTQENNCDDEINFIDFKIGNIFYKIDTPKVNAKANDFPEKYSEEYCIPLLTAGEENQGLNRYAKMGDCKFLINNAISISANGANSGVCFYQSDNFVVLQDAYAVKVKDYEIKNQEVGLYLTTALNKSIRDNHDWVNKAGWNRIKDDIIKLPVNKDGSLNYEYMEKYIRSLEKIVISGTVKYKNSVIEAYKQIEATN